MRKWFLGSFLLGMGGILGLLLGWTLARSEIGLRALPNARPGTVSYGTLTSTPSPRPSSTPTVSPTLSPTLTLSPVPTGQRSQPTPFSWATFPEQGLVLVSVQEGTTSVLYAYHPQRLPWVRLLDQMVRTPALSPSGRWVALSLYDGRWKPVILDMTRGTWREIPESAAYVEAPSWSPDEQWLAYAAYRDDNMDIWIRSVHDPEAAPIRLTEDAAVETSPAWSPQGRVVAFLSLRTGTPQVFLISLDDPEAVRQVSRETEGRALAPAWSPNGRYLAWCQERDGLYTLWIWDVTAAEEPPRALGEGCWPRWRADGEGVWALVLRPEGAYLTQYEFPPTDLVLPLIALPGIQVTGFTAGYSALPWPLPEPMARAAQRTPVPLWTPPPAEASQEEPVVLVPVEDVDVPYPYLSDAVDEAYQTLRRLARSRLGWDPLAQVDSLYRPPTLGGTVPGSVDWLSTGRAFALPVTWLQEGRMVVVREAFPGGLYWRVYLKPEAQDGSQGRPLTQPVWDLDLVQEVPPPPGFWVDFTALAMAVGWERLPALPYWMSYFPAARFHLFVHRAGSLGEDVDPSLGIPVTPGPVPGGTP